MKAKPEILDTVATAIAYVIKKAIDSISFRHCPTYISKNGRLYDNRINIWSDK